MSALKYQVVTPEQNFRGMSYGAWLALWNNWLLSANPDHYDGGPMFFTRGSLDYKSPSKHASFPRSIDKAFHDRTNEKNTRIFEGTAIFVPVITSCYTLESVVNGQLLKTESAVRRFVNKDIQEGSQMWAWIENTSTGRKSALVSNLKDFVVESPLFRLEVPKNSSLNDKQYMPHSPGSYFAVSSACCVILKSLFPSSYRIIFGGKGRGDYFTKAAYDIIVESRSPATIQDISRSESRRSRITRS